MSMAYKEDVIIGQKFDIGRTINFTKCDCDKCDFLNCPKKNYAPRTKPHRYTVTEYIEHYAAELKDGLFATSAYLDDLTDDFMRLFAFPKGTYWRLDCLNEENIELVTFSRSGKELYRGAINRKTGKISEYDFSAGQAKLAFRISHAIMKIRSFVENERGN